MSERRHVQIGNRGVWVDADEIAVLEPVQVGSHGVWTVRAILRRAGGHWAVTIDDGLAEPTEAFDRCARHAHALWGEPPFTGRTDR